MSAFYSLRGGGAASPGEPLLSHAPLASGMPWWLGRGAGLALVLALALAICAMVWVSAWDTGIYTTTPTPLAQRHENVAAAPRPSSVTSSTPSDPPTPVEPRGAASPSAVDRSIPRDATDERPIPTSRGQLVRARAKEIREQARIRRAIRADRENAAFIASFGTLNAPERWVTPISAAYRITATFGQSGSLWSNDHTGVDLAAPTGTPVVSVAAGTVSQAGPAGAYGLKIEITHADGTVAWYGHLSRIDVRPGDEVQVGGVIGTVGVTGNVTGPHLHLELRSNGDRPVDPVQALAARGVHL